MTEIETLKNLIGQIDSFISGKVTSSDPDFRAWKSLVERFLQRKYGKDGQEVEWFKKLRFSLAVPGLTQKEYVDACARKLQEVKVVLNSYLNELEEEKNMKPIISNKSSTKAKPWSADNMKKKYQVFISSTYTDLIEERAAVTQCLLEMNCIPVGMEQFPASDMSQMDYIKMMLDDCDYYILILAGRYGSCDSDGIGFTEKEYDYALSQNIPIMSFVVEDIGKLLNSKCEHSGAGLKKLDAFRKKVCSGKLVKFYSNIGELKAAVAVSLNHCIHNSPAVGWIRGSNISEFDTFKEQILQAIQSQSITWKEIEDVVSDRVKSTAEKVQKLEDEVSSIPRIDVHIEDNDAGGKTLVIDGGNASGQTSGFQQKKVIRNKDPWLSDNDKW